MTDLRFETPAQQRFAHDVLAWGAPRPAWTSRLVDGLRSRLEGAVSDNAAGLRSLSATRPGSGVSIGRGVLQRRVCDGWQLEPEPFTHGWSSVRAELARDAIAADWDDDRSVPTAELVAAVWHAAATRAPGDPSSRSAWLNRRTGDEAAAMRSEVAGLVDDLREVWPSLPARGVDAAVRRPIEVPLAGGLVTLFGVPDLVLDSPVRDDRARALVVDLRTGRPRPVRDREALRFHALLVTLARGRPPFRWASHHVTEGRTESEDLSDDALLVAADAVVEVVEQLARLGGRGPSTIVAGAWCADCRRRDTCEVAAAARADGGRRRAVTPRDHDGHDRDEASP